MKRLFHVFLITLLSIAAYAQDIERLAGDCFNIRIDGRNTSSYLLLPVCEGCNSSQISILADGNLVRTIDVRLAADKVDYYVPLDLREFSGRKLVLTTHLATGGDNLERLIGKLRLSDEFDSSDREQYRPAYHHSPAYGWMNDPNGMFFKDGSWHLYYQYNPYGSMWGNMNWAHASSEDLVHWTQHGVAIAPDALGTIFSGSCVVDRNGTAGYGKDAVIAMYTNCLPTPYGHDIQTQSIAWSVDDGMSFTKYAGNPVLTGNARDFRDPNPFWNEEAGFWNLILACGPHMRLYSSPDLRNWTEESRFGDGYGAHGGVWECPDLVRVPVEGTDLTKWVLVCNINPGGPSGGSATQYFVGDFDGHEFRCESAPETCKWMDYGKDHYATVSFDSAPDGRCVVMAWMSNWEYADRVPTMRYRSCNSIPRDLSLYEKDGEHYLCVRPSREVDAMRGSVKRVRPMFVKGETTLSDVLLGMDGVAELDVRITPSSARAFGFELSNDNGEKVTVRYDMDEMTVSMDRTDSGITGFSDRFPAVTKAPLDMQASYSLRLFMDRCSLELFDSDGRFAMTNLVFPTEPYRHVRFFSEGGKAKCGAEIITLEY